MQVTAYKTVDIEVEVDVEIDNVLQEFAARKDEATPTYFRRLLPAIDCMLRIFMGIPDSVIFAMPDKIKKIICDKLKSEAARYEVRTP